MSWTSWLAPTGAVGGIMACLQAVTLLEQSRKLKYGFYRGVDKVTTVCYLFCLVAYLTAVLGGWLVWSKQVSGTGEPTSTVAKYAFLLAGESIRFEQELIVVGVVLSIVIVPQLLNYLVAGLFGAAGGTKFGAWCLRFAYWTILKGFAVAGGVSVAWGLMAAWCNWPKAYESPPGELISSGCGQIAMASLGTLLAGPLEDRSLEAMRSRLRPITRHLEPAHRWLTRNHVPASEELKE